MKYIFILCLFFSISNYSQDSINGILLDSIVKTPIEYVSVYIKNTNFGTYSDASGKFQLHNLKDNDTIVFSMIGYKKQEIPYQRYNQSNYKIILEQSTIDLDEVIITSHPIRGKWEKKFNRNKSKFNVLLFEGTIIQRETKQLKKAIIGLRFYLRSNFDTKITLRPIVKDIKGNPLLYKEYTSEFYLQKNRYVKVDFEFNEVIQIPENGIVIGVETLKLDNNNAIVQIECSDDLNFDSKMITRTNFIQHNGKNMNFNKKLDNNIFIEVKIPN